MLSIWSILYLYARPLIKWFLRRFTRLCELQRICYGSDVGAARHKGIEESLTLSRQKPIKLVLQSLDDHVNLRSSVHVFRTELVPDAVITVAHCKQIKAKIHPDFAKMLSTSIETIWSYRRLFATVEATRTTPYDTDRHDHEAKLLKLWRLLMPEQELESRITKQWQDIGFQVSGQWAVGTRCAPRPVFDACEFYSMFVLDLPYSTGRQSDERFPWHGDAWSRKSRLFCRRI